MEKNERKKVKSSPKKKLNIMDRGETPLTFAKKRFYNGYMDICVQFLWRSVYILENIKLNLVLSLVLLLNKLSTKLSYNIIS